jgi:hypothetical protein
MLTKDILFGLNVLTLDGLLLTGFGLTLRRIGRAGLSARPRAIYEPVRRVHAFVLTLAIPIAGIVTSFLVGWGTWRASRERSHKMAYHANLCFILAMCCHPRQRSLIGFGYLSVRRKPPVKSQPGR